MCVSLKQLTLKISKNLLNEVGVRPGGFREIFLFKKVGDKLKIVKTMGNIRLSFYDEQENKIEVKNTDFNEITIQINDGDVGNRNCAEIFLDVDTAVKFCKELRKQIGEAKEDINLNSQSNG